MQHKDVQKIAKEFKDSLEKPPPPPDENSPEYVDYVIRYGSPKPLKPDDPYIDCPWKHPAFWPITALIIIIAIWIITS